MEVLARTRAPKSARTNERTRVRAHAHAHTHTHTHTHPSPPPHVQLRGADGDVRGLRRARAIQRKAGGRPAHQDGRRRQGDVRRGVPRLLRQDARSGQVTRARARAHARVRVCARTRSARACVSVCARVCVCTLARAYTHAHAHAHARKRTRARARECGRRPSDKARGGRLGGGAANNESTE